MRELLAAAGWYKYTHCNCGGTLKEKYKHPTKPGQEVHIQPNRNQWYYFVNKNRNNLGVGATIQQVL